MNTTLSTSKWNVLTLTSSASHIVKCSKSKMEEKRVSKIRFPTCMNICQIPYIDFLHYQNEEKHLRYCITKNLGILRQVYDKYASICVTHQLDYKPVLVRMYLWQLWRDLGIVDDTITIYDIDLVLSQNPQSGYQTVHGPFEKIYFWQFLQVKFDG